MLALAMYRDSRCPCGCGHNVAETTAPEEGRDRTRDWKVRRTRCHARAAMEQAQQQASDKPEDLPGARLWWTEKAR